MWYNQIPPAWAFPVMRSLENLYFNEIELLSCRNIHPKRWFPRFQESADNFEFSAERLSEIAKSIKITLFAELLTVISPNYVQSLLNFSMKTLKHSIFSKKCPIHTKFFVAIYALFPQIFWNWKAQSADFIVFRMYGIILTGTINQFTSLQHNPQVLQLAGEEIANCQLFVVWPSGSKFALGLRNCLAKVV